MCVIIYKPKNQDLPTIETLKKCIEKNGDGAGYMAPVNNQVIIHKGFNKLDDLLKDIQKLLSDNNLKIKDIPLVLHFRISTQGGTKKELCHPYPLTNDYARMRELKTTADIGIAHNGIIHLTSCYSQKVNYNDTMTFIKDYLSLIIGNDLYFDKRYNKMQLIKNLIGEYNKLAIMTKDGYVSLINKFYKVGGCYYSNLNHLQQPVMLNTKLFNFKEMDQAYDNL